MAKKKYRTIGSVVKSKDKSSPDYIKIGRDDVVLKAGSTLQLQSKASQLASLEKAIEAGKISGESAEKARARLEKIPDFVRFEVVQVTEE